MTGRDPFRDVVTRAPLNAQVYPSEVLTDDAKRQHLCAREERNARCEEGKARDGRANSKVSTEYPHENAESQCDGGETEGGHHIEERRRVAGQRVEREPEQLPQGVSRLAGSALLVSDLDMPETLRTPAEKHVEGDAGTISPCKTVSQIRVERSEGPHKSRLIGSDGNRNNAANGPACDASPPGMVRPRSESVDHVHISVGKTIKESRDLLRRVLQIVVNRDDNTMCRFSDSCEKCGMLAGVPAESQQRHVPAPLSNATGDIACGWAAGIVDKHNLKRSSAAIGPQRSSNSANEFRNRISPAEDRNYDGDTVSSPHGIPGPFGSSSAGLSTHTCEGESTRWPRVADPWEQGRLMPRLTNVGLLAAGSKGMMAAKEVSERASISWIASYEVPGTDEPTPRTFEEAFPRAQIHQGRHPDMARLGSVDLVIAAGWQFLVTTLGAPMVILHDSLLPALRGFAPTVTALIQGDERIGVTAILPAERADEGDIVSQHGVSVAHPIRIRDALKLLQPLYGSCIDDVLLLIGSGGLVGTPQDHTAATYSIWRDADDYALDFSKPAEQLIRTIYALGDPYSGASASLSGKRVIVRDAEPVEDIPFAIRQPGKVWGLHDGTPVVVCGQGMIRLTDIRDEAGVPVRVSRLRTRFGA